MLGILPILWLPLTGYAQNQPQNSRQSSDNKSDSGKNSKKQTSKKSSTKKKTTSSSSSKSKNTSKSSKKSTSSSKKKSSSSQKKDTDTSPEKLEFTQKQIEEYKAMPYDTWESPSGTSELGLPIEEGFVQPYPYGNLMRQYDGNKCHHRGLDIGVVGKENNGMGTVVNAMTHSVITLIGKAGENVGEFGKLDTRTGTVTRTGRTYPRQILVPGYGVVYPFSRNYGRWRSGTVIVTRVLEGPLKDYIVRYMHLAAVRPDLKVGSEVQAGEHIALMGGTAVMDSYPHVHIDMETPDKKRVDPGPYIGLRGTGVNCGLEAPEVTPGHSAMSSKASPSSKMPKRSNSKKSIIQTTSASQGKNKRVNSESENSVMHKRRPNYISELPQPEEPVIRVLERTDGENKE